ncbi:MAG: DUF4296 domain-containing protein [Ignavibacteria bacterium]|nr:DUF4296 domain-containing protein [Ignavibacteria bacterium]
MAGKSKLLILTALLGFGCLVAVNCHPNGSRIPEQKFVNYYIDLLGAQDSLGTDSLTGVRIHDFLQQKYAVTKQDVKETLEYYSSEPKRWDKFYGLVLSELQHRVEKSIKKP